MLFNPYVMLALLLAFLGFGASSFIYGRHVAKVECEAAQVRAVNAAIAEKDKELKKANDQSAKFEKEKALAKESIRSLDARYKAVVTRLLYRNDCFDADGVRLANDAVFGPSHAPGQPDRAVPRSPAP